MATLLNPGLRILMIILFSNCSYSKNTKSKQIAGTIFGLLNSLGGERNMLFFEKPSRHALIPPNQIGTIVKDACRVGKVYWRRERAHDKTRIRDMFCGVYSRCIYRVRR